jgi:hypothetical protein
MRIHNSTITLKQKTCRSCGKPCYWFSKQRCEQCARIEGALEKMTEQSKKEASEQGLTELIEIADDYFSKLVRLSNADDNGIVKCYTCDAEMRWQEAQCGHYIKRGNLFLRYDHRNCRVQCKDCNEYKDGNMAEYTSRLELEQPGITDILREEAAVVYKPARHELQGIITDCKRKLKAYKWR